MEKNAIKEKNILHITPHLGGGVGSVVLNWMKKDSTDTNHTIVVLDKNNNKDWIEVNENCKNVNIFDASYFRSDFKEFLTQNIINHDIVLIHWWNHPLLYDVMINFDWCECRLIMWNHVSGLFAPYVITQNDIDFCDKFIFTSPVSYEAKEIQNLSEEKKQKLDVIWSTIGVEDFKNLKRTEHDNFIVGYTGTVDFGKLNPNFIDLCTKVQNPDIKFVVCSGDSQQHLIDEAKAKGISDKFSFEGRVPSILPYLAKFDVFGYPLQPQHFATCEQSLGEAMMAGCVPVVLNNPTERYIVKHMETGIVANSLEEYSQAIEYLYNNRDLMKKLAANAQKYAEEQYDIQKTINKWHRILDEEMNLPKKKRIWNSDFSTHISPAELYIASLENHAKPLINYLDAQTTSQKQTALLEIKELFDTNSMFYSQNKGSVLQYLRFFPNDKNLQIWGDIITKEAVYAK